ncbi:TetR/AcrR family transcriptional regulator [Sinomonas gamaensis]|jgi:AcrR family transcriptional regulator|uniref:TetR/AcrR family transcriptional regulator n=1 Tax=Sinomonas gamaensis TaxID=2565624 RepID=UPI001486DAD6|nr:TetR/AcrR family transcriptional regulator [Sinomonas gamaensis]
MSPRAESIAIKGEQTRKAVLDTAIQLFGEHGYDGCSLSQIAKRSGVVQSALHYHFGTKDRLLAEALESHYPRSATRPDLEAIERGETTFSEEIVRVTAKNAADPHLVRFFSVMSGESLTESHPAARFFRERYAIVTTGMTNAIARSQGVTDPEAISRLALLVRTVYAGMDGLQMQWLRDPEVDLVGGVRLLARMAEAEIQRIAG